MLKTNRQWLAVLFIAAGALVLMVVAGVLFVSQLTRRRPAPTATATAAQAAAVETATPVKPTATPEPTTPPTLSATAAAAATALPTVTPIPTAEEPAAGGSAAVRILASSVGIDAPVVEVGWRVAQVGGEARAVWETVGNAAGHHRGSADPGQPGNCVLSGHSSDEGGAVFKRLGELVPGDTVDVIAADGVRYTYRVSWVQTLEETGATDEEKRAHAQLMDPTDEPALTLITCWPDWSYTQRIVVRGELVAAE